MNLEFNDLAGPSSPRDLLFSVFPSVGITGPHAPGFLCAGC